MTPRRKRLFAVLGVLAGVGAAAALAMLAFEDNLLYFYNPTQVLAGDAPDGRMFRIGGMVTEGSLARTEGTLEVRFVVTDRNRTQQVASGDSIIVTDSAGVQHQLVLHAFSTKSASAVTTRR